MKAISHGAAARSAAAVTGFALIMGASLLAAGCSARPATGSSSAMKAAGSAPGLAEVPAPAGRTPARLASLRIPGGQSVIYTATLTVQASDVSAAADRASQIALSAGGYVSSEDTTAAGSHVRPRAMVQLKIPVAAYPASLVSLARLGKKLSESQHAEDVTQVVADVTSRVASAKAAIAQLRSLLARAGSVGSLLQVQNEINTEESNLEALQSQQRALSGETSYGTVTLLLVSRPVAAVVHHRVKLGSGFTGGFGAGWQALRDVISWALTGAGAMLPFVIPVALAAFGGYRARRWRNRRRVKPSPAE
jgi:hypothetical protein